MSATVIESPETLVLFSYTTAVAYFNKTTKEAFQTDVKHSRTTAKHINKFWADMVTRGSIRLIAFTPMRISQAELSARFPLQISTL